MPTILGNKILGNGVNLQPSYYNPLTVNLGWDLMLQHPYIKTVRIQIEPDQAAAAKAWIAAAQSRGYQVIATYHKSTVLGSNDITELIQAADWWVTHYHELGGNFIINLMNEWGNHQLTPGLYSGAYNQAIKGIRQVYSDYIIVDLPGWGQDIDTACNAVIYDPKIAWSVHIYPSGYNTNRTLMPAHLDHLAATKRPCLVGEFGNQNTGNCDWKACIAHARDELKWTVMGWCWNGDGDEHGVYNMVSPSWKTDSTATSFTKSSYFDTIYSRL
jgi:mannan endo-1,4-beta-mannosidase